jgi:transposase-like protein
VEQNWYVDEIYVKVQGHWPYLYRAIDRHDAYPWATRKMFGEPVAHRTNRYLNNHLEQDHRGIQECCRPMAGFKHGATAARFCLVFDEVRAFLCPQSHSN